jgi:LmbE family N-acetylglucosaminyl deacetylase
MKRYDRIYLSPHLDDAVFSCGGRIRDETRRGLSVLIATVATAEPPGALSTYAVRFHRRAGLGADAMARRRAEDEKAAARLGAETLHLGLPDAIYRRDARSGRPLYPGLRSLLGRPRAGDPLERLLRRRLQELPGSARLLLPLALGGHVDHRITRATAEAACADRELELWEDFPYLTRRLPWGPRRPRHGGCSELHELGREALAARCRAMAAYGSQVRAIFGGEARMRRLVERSVRKTGGERTWHRQ